MGTERAARNAAVSAGSGNGRGPDVGTDIGGAVVVSQAGQPEMVDIVDTLESSSSDSTSDCKPAADGKLPTGVSGMLCRARRLLLFLCIQYSAKVNSNASSEGKLGASEFKCSTNQTREVRT